MKFQQQRQRHPDCPAGPHSPCDPTQRQRGFDPKHELWLCLHGDEPAAAGGNSEIPTLTCSFTCSSIKHLRVGAFICTMPMLVFICMGTNLCEELWS